MKKSFSVFFLLLLAIAADAQNIGTKWVYHTNSFSLWFKDSVSTLTYTKDTLVSEKVCRKFDLSMKVDSSGGGFEYYKGLFYLTYQEGNKIYNWNGRKETFSLIYDFDANVDDIWELDNGLVVYVDSISYQNFDGQRLKNLHVTYRQDDPFLFKHRCSIITEKLGDQSYYFMYTLGDDPGEFEPYRLSRVVTDSSDYKNLNPNGIPCIRRVFVGLQNDHKDSKISVYPSVATDRISIANFDASMYAKISLLNTKGNQMKLILNNNVLQINHLENGLYILGFNANDGSIERVKFIKN